MPFPLLFALLLPPLAMTRMLEYLQTQGRELRKLTLRPRSMLNNLRILDTWLEFFGDPQGSNLGLLTALYSIGSIASLPVT